MPRCKLLPEPHQVGARKCSVDTRDDIRACVRARVCTRVCASVRGGVGEPTCEDVPGQRSSALLRARTEDRGVTAEGEGKFIISVIPERERVIGRDIIDR